MKKTLTAMTLLAGAVSVYSQGSVSMQDYASGFLTVQVFTAQAAGAGTLVTDGQFTGFEVMGNTANTYNRNPGNTLYSTGAPLGPGYDVGLLGASGVVAQGNYGALSLASGSVVTTWENSLGSTTPSGNGNYGSWLSANVATVPGSGSTFTIAIAAWKNSGAAGAAATLAQAQADGYAWGVSTMVTTTLATGSASPGFLPVGNGGITDFSLVAPASTPEPSTIALGVIGASTLLFRRRK